VSKDGRSADPQKFDAVDSWPVPTTVHDIMAFMGLMNYFRAYIPLFSAVAAPLVARLQGSPKKTAGVSLDPPALEAFSSLKKLLRESIVLRPIDLGRPLFVATDASLFGVGGALFQLDPAYSGDPLDAPVEARQFVALHSRSLTRAERNYSATKRELLGIVDCFRVWREYLLGAPFTLHTDHKALTFMLTQRTANPMLERWLDIVTELVFDPVHCPGVLNTLPDSLSRLYPDHVATVVRDCPDDPLRFM
jgi:hypothetical protein